MRVVITGGTGLIGKALAENLTNGYDVVVLSRSPENHKDMPSGVKVVEYDPDSAETFAAQVDGAHAVINLAGAGIADKRWSKERKQLIVDSRVETGHAVTEAIQRAESKPKVLLQASAVGFYGDRDEEILTERSVGGEGFLADVVRQWEASTTAVEGMDVRRVVLRTGVVLAPDDGALPQLMLPFKFGVGGNLGDGEQWLPWIHIEDEVRAIRWLLENPKAQGVYNLSAPAPVKNTTVTQKLGTVLDKPTFVPGVPKFALKLMLGDMAQAVLDSNRVIPMRLGKEGFIFNYADLETALRDLLN